MSDDREPFEQARAAGLAKRHERRLAHAREADDFVIPEEAVEAVAQVITSQDLPSAHYDEEQDLAHNYARAALEAALPHLRAHQIEARDEGLAAEVEPWLQQCGSCDAALPMGCTCPKGDYRNILLKVWRAYEASQAETKALAETATKLGYELGRKEALEEAAQVLDGMAAMWATPDDYPEDWDAHHLVVRNASQAATKNAAKAVRDIAKGTS